MTLETFVSKVLVPDWWVVGPKDWKYCVLRCYLHLWWCFYSASCVLLPDRAGENAGSARNAIYAIFGSQSVFKCSATKQCWDMLKMWDQPLFCNQKPREPDRISGSFSGALSQNTQSLKITKTFQKKANNICWKRTKSLRGGLDGIISPQPTNQPPTKEHKGS